MKKYKYFLKKEKYQGLMYYVIYERTFFGLIKTPYDYYLDEAPATYALKKLNERISK